MAKKGIRLQEEQRRQFRNIKRKIPTFNNFELITLKKQELRWTFPPSVSSFLHTLVVSYISHHASGMFQRQTEQTNPKPASLF